jgi:hypothetical protein
MNIRGISKFFYACKYINETDHNDMNISLDESTPITPKTIWELVISIPLSLLI